MNAGGGQVAPVALTFDDGPDPVWTPRVLDALSGVRASATFFVVAPQARRYPLLLTRMRNEGHEVAFHCTRHLRHDGMTRREIMEDATRGLPSLGASARYWRTPWGVVGATTGHVATAHALTLVGWTTDTEDWRGGTHGEMLARIEGGISREAIVLMHDGVGPGATRNGCAETVSLVGPLVSLIRSRGLKPTLLEDLSRPLPDRNPDLTAAGDDMLHTGPV